MRKGLTLVAVVLLGFISCVSAFGAENGGEKPVAADKSVTASEGPEEGRTKMTCPGCGRGFAVGRHGQAAGSVICPYCGEEIYDGDKADALCFGADMGFFSKYVSRGLTYSEDPVFQPNVWASYRGLTFNIWGSVDMTDYNGLAGDFYEVDYGLDYSGSAGKLCWSAGALYYSYPRMADADTAEAYVGLDCHVPLRPSLVIYYDFGRGDGFYGTFSIGHCLGLPDVIGCKAELELSAQVGLGSKDYNVHNYGSDHAAFTDMVFSAGLPVAVSEKLTVTPSVSYSSVLDQTIRTKNMHNDAVIFGGTISAAF